MKTCSRDEEERVLKLSGKVTLVRDANLKLKEVA